MDKKHYPLVAVFGKVMLVIGGFLAYSREWPPAVVTLVVGILAIDYAIRMRASQS